ncbi:hypothetical protein SNE40_012581 [Patella caerulea]|uniref:28S ribosomal protein S27, mitochondrial n=1 Tax=Patella caerulea TaxID=87958 RepID=A0AAN8JM53_PATCE
MAASAWKTCCSTLKHVKLSTKGVSFSARRYLLSEAYSCQDAWKQRLESSTLQQGSLNEFAVQLRERFEKEKKASVVDVDILANRLHEIEVTNAEFMEEILHRFRRSVDSVPVNDSIVYAVVRAYIDLGLTDRLLLLMKDKWNYGIFPNDHGVSVLLDHLIKENKYQDAAQVAYEMMLQEDFNHPITYLLSLYGCSQHYTSISLDPPEEKQVDPDEEEDWIPVKYIRFPVYDDHFDIKDERFLMGKTLYMLGKTCQDGVLGRSLQFMGLGMYHKFEKAIKLLENWEKDQPGVLLLNEAVVKFEESLVKAETRPDEEPEIDMGLRTIDDEIKLLRLTADEKDNFIQQLNEIKSRIQEKVKDEDLQNMVENFTKSQISEHEQSDIEKQTNLISTWTKERETLVDRQIWEFTRRQKEEELKTKLQDLQKKEEMLRFFELRDEIIIAKQKAPKVKPAEVEEDEEVIIAKRKKRRQYRPAV